MSSGGKFSFLDGVPFAINPIFLTGASTKVCHFESYPLQALIIYDNHSTFKTIKDPEYDLADSYTMLNYKFNYSTEEKFLKALKKTKRKKELMMACQLEDQQLSLSYPMSGLQKSTLSSPLPTPNTQIDPNVQSLYYMESLDLANKRKDSNFKVPMVTNHQTLLPIYTNCLLEPTREPAKAKASTSNPPATALNRQDSAHDMFGSGSLDPFNDMELKTINDIEELKTILNNQQQQHELELSQALISRPLSHLTTSQDNFGLPKISFVDNDSNSK